MRNVLVIRPGAMGDVCLTIPVVRALESCCRISWLIFEHYAPLVRATGLSGCSLLPMNPQRSRPTLNGPILSQMRRTNFDVLMDLCHWPETIDLVAQLQDVPLRGTVHDPEQDRRLGINPRLCDLYAPFNRLVGAQRADHQVIKWRRLFAATLDLELELEQPVKRCVTGGPLRVFVQPHAGKASKIWPVRRYAAVLTWLHERRPIEVVINAGNRQEWPRAVRLWASLRWRRVPAVILLKDRSYRRLVEALASVHLALGNDSGPMHLASILGVPSVVVYGPFAPQEFSPIWYSEAAAPPAGSSAAAVSEAAVRAALDEVLRKHVQDLPRQRPARADRQAELAR